MTNYEIMHGDNLIATITSQGQCRILLPAFMPCNLYLEATDELDGRVNNITNFYYWCATRVLTLDRKYAKQILNSMGMSQATTDKERARIALSYHCLTLTDIYWVREAGEVVSFALINLYENHLSNAFIDVSLKGHQMTVENAYLLADDASTSGCFPKAWLRAAKWQPRMFMLKHILNSIQNSSFFSSAPFNRFGITAFTDEYKVFDKAVGKGLRCNDKILILIHWHWTARELTFTE